MSMSKTLQHMALPTVDTARSELARLRACTWDDPDLAEELARLDTLVRHTDTIVAKAVAAGRLAQDIGADHRFAVALAVDALIRNDARIERQLLRLRGARSRALLCSIAETGP